MNSMTVKQIYNRLSEAEIIEKVLGKEPALKLLELCKKELSIE